jgi:hypothetical protein
VAPVPEPPPLPDRPALAAIERLETGWTRLAPPPGRRYSAALVWIGTGLVLWGGDSRNDGLHHADGSVWDPLADAWTPLPSSPLSGRSQPAAVWTGRELLVWGGLGPEPKADGAAYDPAARTWRMLPPAPLDPRAPVVAVWTGDELVVWGDTSRERPAADGAAYNPETDAWRAIASAPAALNEATGVWTGREVVVVGAELDNANRPETKTALALAYDPAADVWRRLPDPPLLPHATTAAATPDGEVVAWDYVLESATWLAARGARWQPEVDVPLDASECYPASAVTTYAVVGWYCGRGAAFAPPERTWKEIPPRTGFDAGPVGVGPVAFFVGPGLAAYRPRR